MARVAMLVSNGHAPDPRVEKEADALADAGHDVTVYAFDRHREHRALEHAGPVRVERVSPPGALPRKLEPAFRYSLRNGLRSPVSCWRSSVTSYRN